MVLRKIIFQIIFLSIPFYTICQVSDDFTDGEISSNPAWSGDTSLFWVVDPGNSGDGSLAAGANDDGMVLCSKADQNDAVITTQSSVSAGEWIFSVADGKGWALSSTNNFCIILMSDENDVTKLTAGNFDFNGYYLKRGDSNNDSYELYRQDGTSSIMILNTDYPAVADGIGSETGHTIKITRDNNGSWSVYINESFDTIPITLRGISVTDTIHNASSFFGVSTNITNASTKRVLYFDNLSINTTGVCVSPPSNLVIHYVAPDKMNVKWTKPSGVYGTDWDGVIVFAREGNPNDAVLGNTDANDYTGNNIYGSGTQNNNSFCVVNQNGNNDGDVVITGLSGGQDYFFVAYAYSENAGNDNDDWSAAATEVNDTSGVRGVSGFSSLAGEESASLSWMNYTSIPGTWWNEVMIVGKISSAVDQFPLGDGTNYTANQEFGLGTEIGGSGSGNFVVYKDIGNTASITGLTNDSTYYFRAYVRYDTLWTEAGKYKDISVIPSSSKIFISEIADPHDNINARFVELFNGGTYPVDFDSEQWYLCKQTNGVTWDEISLTGEICPGCTHVVSYNVTDFVNSYFFQPDQASTIVSGNGDDGYFLYKSGGHSNGQLIDAFGEIDQDGSGTPWEYTDSRVIRKDTVNSANAVWKQQDWIIINQSATGDMDPGRHKQQIQWQGSVSASWNDGANWKGGVIPDTATTTIIDDFMDFMPEISGSSFCYKLLLMPTGRMNIKSGGNLNVINDFIIKSDNSGTGSVISESNSIVTCGGQIIVERHFSSNDKWHFISSPISGSNASVFLGGYLNSWDETNQLWEHITNPGDSLNIAEGYSVKLPTTFGNKALFISSSGSLNAGSYNTKPLTYTYGQDSSLNGFNFIGNPYPSSVDWDLVSIPNFVDAAIYYWDPSAGLDGMYKSYVPGVGGSGSGYIPPMYGVFIHATDSANGALINFDNSVRTHIGQNISYKNCAYKNLLTFNVCGNKYCDETHLNFNDSATIDYDSRFDAYKLFSFDTVVPQIYTRIKGADLSVNSMSLPAGGVIIPMGFRCRSAGLFTISLDQYTIYNSNNSIFLKDLFTGSIVNLLNNNSYTFSHLPCNNPGRFLLYVNYIFVDKKKNFSLTDVQICSTGSEIIIKSEINDKLIHVEIMNMLGQVIKSSEIINQSIKYINMTDKPGIYLVRVLCGDEIITEKVLLD